MHVLIQQRHHCLQNSSQAPLVTKNIFCFKKIASASAAADIKSMAFLKALS